MKKALIILVGLWVFYIVLVLIPDRILLNQSLSIGRNSIGRVGLASAEPVVMLWFEPPSDEKVVYRTQETLRIVLCGSVVTVGDRAVPVAELTDYINQQLREHEFRYVILSPRTNSTMQEVISGVDACRRSRVHTVLLNYYAMP